ncbi:MAG: hypothetical protein QOE00_124 [Ilumatobacteraceae bacterium]
MKTQRFPEANPAAIEAAEIIEIIDDENDAFGDRPRAGTLHDLGGPRWVGPVAAAALIGFTGFGVVTSASSSGVPTAAVAASTTLAPTSTGVAPSSAPVPAQDVAFYAADPPRDFTVQHADLEPLDPSPVEGYAYELWALPDSSATTGSWFSVTTYPATSSLIAADAYRLQVGRLSIAISHTAAGQTVAQYLQDDRMGVTITSLGWSDSDLVRLATSIQADEHSISFTDAWFKPTHKLQNTVQPWLAVQSIPAEHVDYVSGSDPDEKVVITVGRLLPPGEGGAPGPRQVALRYLLDHSTPFTVDGRAAVAGSVVSQPGRSLATWIADDQVISVSGTLPVAELIAVARTVHQVSPQEWEGMKLQATKNHADPAGDERGASHYVAAGHDSASAAWDLSVAAATSDGQRQISWTWIGNGFTTYPTETAQIHSVVADGRTYVLADVPRSVVTSATLAISGAGFDMTVPFGFVGSELDRTVAGYAFSETGPFTATILGPDGSVLATWPSP